MSTGLLRLHEPAVLILTLGDPQQFHVHRDRCPACQDDLASMSCPLDDTRIILISYFYVRGREVLVKLWLILSPGSSLTGF